MDTTKIVEKIKYGNVELKMKTTTLQAKSVDPSVDEQFVFPDSEYGGLSSVTVTGVTNSIDKNIIPGNIRKGKVILGVEGDMEPDKPDQSKTIKPTKEEQEVHADRGYELLSVTVEGVTSDIDENIQADNIRYGVEILGVVGSMEQKEDLDAELTEQESLLSDLQSQVDNLPEINLNAATATESDVVKGKTFFSGDNVIKTGTLEVPDLSATTATAEDVLQGKKFYNAQGEFVEGKFKNTMQTYIDINKTGYKLFWTFPDEDMSWVKNLDTSQVTTMDYMFSYCTNATVIDVSNFNTSNVKKMDNMFGDCRKVLELDCSSFDTRNVTNMYGMFYQDFALQKLDVSNFDISNVTSISSMFYQCRALKVLDLSRWDMSKLTNTYNVFNGCGELESIIGNLDMISNTNFTGTFSNCYKLKDLTLKNIKSFLNMFECKLLTNESLINTFKELWDLTGSTSQRLILSTASKNNIANIYVKLIPVTDEMRAEDPYIDNKKPCVVCESTDEGAMTLTEFAISKNWAIA